MLFVASLVSPDEYLCPDDDEQGSPFFSYPSTDSGTSILEYLQQYFTLEHILGLVAVSIFALPVYGLLSFDFWLGELLDKDRDNQFERIVSVNDVILFQPEDIETFTEAIAVQYLLKRLKWMLHMQVRKLSAVHIDPIVIEELAMEQHGVRALGLTDLVSAKQELEQAYNVVCDKLVIVKDRVQELQSEIRESIVPERSGLWYGLKARWRAHKMLHKQLREGLILTAPKFVQSKLKQHDIVKHELKGTICGVKIAGLSSIVLKLKQFFYNRYYMHKKVGGMKERLSRTMLKLLKRFTTILSVLVLAYLTFHVTLYAINLKDNQVVAGVLWSVLFAILIEIILTGPSVILFLNGVVPAVASAWIRPEIQSALESNRGKMEKTGAEQDDLDDIIVIDPFSSTRNRSQSRHRAARSHPQSHSRPVSHSAFDDETSSSSSEFDTAAHPGFFPSPHTRSTLTYDQQEVDF